jgi:hypothetical protein
LPVNAAPRRESRITPDDCGRVCERWHDGEHRPGGVISESVARHRDERGQQYMVVLGEQEQPDALIEVNWSLDFLGTWFLDDKLRRNLNYLFLRVDPETLFSNRSRSLGVSRRHRP